MPIIMRSTKEWRFPIGGVAQSTPSPYLYQIALDHTVPTGMAFHDGLVDIAKAHQSQEIDRRYACYGSWIGKGIVWLIVPMSSANEILHSDEIMSPSIMSRMYGNDKGIQLLEHFKSTLISSEAICLKWMPEYSLIPVGQKEEKPWPFEYLYYTVIQLNEHVQHHELVNALAVLKGKISQSKQGIQAWATYLDQNTGFLHVYTPMRAFHGMDHWGTLSSFWQSLGQEGSPVRQTLTSAIQSYNTQIMTFVPSCDHSGCEFIDEIEITQKELSHV